MVLRWVRWDWMGWTVRYLRCVCAVLFYFFVIRCMENKVELMLGRTLAFSFSVGILR